MLTLSLVAAGSAMLCFRLMWARLERRETAVAVRRLALRAPEKTVRGCGRG
jgi:hypothetical protein